MQPAAGGRLRKGVRRYLVSTARYGLVYGQGSTAAGVLGYCDSDYAGCPDSARSTTGYVFTLGGAAVSWQSRLQPTVAASTQEAEYMAAAAAVKEALWLRQLLQYDFEVDVGALHLRCDNQAALQLLKNPVISQRSKHISVHYHLTRERVAMGEVEFSYVESARNVADCMTKALPERDFVRGRDSMGLRGI